MKKLKLDTSKLLLRKEKIVTLTENQMSKIFGGEPETGITNKTCCFQSEYGTCGCTNVSPCATSACDPTAACPSSPTICAGSATCGGSDVPTNSNPCD